MPMSPLVGATAALVGAGALFVTSLPQAHEPVSTRAPLVAVLDAQSSAMDRLIPGVRTIPFKATLEGAEIALPEEQLSDIAHGRALLEAAEDEPELFGASLTQARAAFTCWAAIAGRQHADPRIELCRERFYRVLQHALERAEEASDLAAAH